MDLSEFKFLSPVMNLIIEGEPSEENIVEVTFTVNNLTDKIEPFMLHRCEEHGWEILKAEKIPVLLGGEHLVTLAAVRAVFHK